MSPLAAELHRLLPQTQCTRCGYPDCAAYAAAIANHDAAINQCPPGGVEGVARLAQITGLPALPLNPTNGMEGPRKVAWIDENWCIGCTLCIAACPTDAIVGSNKRMHTVMEAFCTGCELCMPVCPVDCIVLESVKANGAVATGWAAWSQSEADQALNRYCFHSYRSKLEKGQGTKTYVSESESTGNNSLASSAPVDPNTKQSLIAAALAKARSARAR